MSLQSLIRNTLRLLHYATLALRRDQTPSRIILAV